MVLLYRVYATRMIYRCTTAVAQELYSYVDIDVDTTYRYCLYSYYAPTAGTDVLLEHGCTAVGVFLRSIFSNFGA